MFLSYFVQYILVCYFSIQFLVFTLFLISKYPIIQLETVIAMSSAKDVKETKWQMKLDSIKVS